MPQHLHKFMAIDPGVNTGWAYWGAKDTIVPEDTGVFRAPGFKERGLEQRLHFMFKEFTKLMEMYQPNFVVIESTEDWGNQKSRVSSLSGALQLLSWLVGGYAALSPAFMLKLPREWKGGLSAKALELRIARAFKKEWLADGIVATDIKFIEHTQEAVGLGLSVLEVL
jgi:hypothetical protein